MFKKYLQKSRFSSVYSQYFSKIAPFDASPAKESFYNSNLCHHYLNFKESFSQKTSKVSELLRDFPDLLLKVLVEGFTPRTETAFSLATSYSNKNTSNQQANWVYLFSADKPSSSETNASGTSQKPATQTDLEREKLISTIKIEREKGLLALKFFEKLYAVVCSLAAENIATFTAETRKSNCFSFQVQVASSNILF